jgi:hypothetical protein
MNVLMRGWIGFIMFFMLNSVMELGLPQLAVLVPLGLFVATGVIEEWKMRLGRRRSQASAALHSYLDDAAAQASNDVNQLMRQLEQNMRESYGRHIDREEQALDSAHDEARAAVDQLEQAPAAIAEIDAGLDYYETLGHRAGALVAAQLLVSAE